MKLIDGRYRFSGCYAVISEYRGQRLLVALVELRDEATIIAAAFPARAKPRVVLVDARVELRELHEHDEPEDAECPVAVVRDTVRDDYDVDYAPVLRASIEAAE